jgi:hypothetical protein
MACSVCGGTSHTKRTCPNDARRPFPEPQYKPMQCKCCGTLNFHIQAHHTRGRGNNNPKTRLYVCEKCHQYCGHPGKFTTEHRKPRVCRLSGLPSHWRGCK